MIFSSPSKRAYWAKELAGWERELANAERYQAEGCVDYGGEPVQDRIDWCRSQVKTLKRKLT